MKLAYISKSKIPSREANSIQVMKMCQAFAGLGHDVTLFAPRIRQGVEDGVTDVFEFYDVSRSFEVRHLPWIPVRGRAWIYGWQAGDSALRRGCDLVYGRSLHGCGIAAMRGLPTIWEVHLLTFLDKAPLRWLFRRMTEAPDFRLIVTISEALRKDLVRRFPELDGRVRVAHDAADPVCDQIDAADLGAMNGRPQVGYVGHLYPGRGFGMVRALATRLPNVDFHVAGGDERTLAALAEEKLPGNLHLHGFVPPRGAARLRIACDVLLAPYGRSVQVAGSRSADSSAWMSPLKLFEYMATGKPMIVSDHPVLREVLAHERNALLCTPDDVDAWVGALMRLIEDGELRSTIGRTARDDFLRHHTWKGRAEQVLSGWDRD